MLAELTDEHLDRSGVFTMRGEPRTAERMAQSLVSHMRGHFEHMRAAVGS